MTLLAQVGTQLEDNLTSFQTVALAWTTTPIADFDAETPAALYYLSGIQSESSPYNTEIIQPGDYEVTVLMVCPVVDIEALLAEMDGVMVGFQPTGSSFEAFQHVSGNALDIKGTLIWWRSVYAARNYRE